MDLLRYHRQLGLDEDLPPELRKYVEKLYLEGWEAYIDARCPFGKHDIGMLMWFEFAQRTTLN